VQRCVKPVKVRRRWRLRNDQGSFGGCLDLRVLVWHTSKYWSKERRSIPKVPPVHPFIADTHDLSRVLPWLALISGRCSILERLNRSFWGHSPPVAGPPDTHQKINFQSAVAQCEYSLPLSGDRHGDSSACNSLLLSTLSSLTFDITFTYTIIFPTHINVEEQTLRMQTTSKDFCARYILRRVHPTSAF